MHDAIPLAPISWGELIDKITILEIKTRKIASEAGLANVRRELALLNEIAAPALRLRDDVQALKSQLREANEKLWDIEDAIRRKEAAKTFDRDFVELARSVYMTNGERSRWKREISDALGSGLIEEKNYAPY